MKQLYPWKICSSFQHDETGSRKLIDVAMRYNGTNIDEKINIFHGTFLLPKHLMYFYFIDSKLRDRLR